MHSANPAIPFYSTSHSSAAAPFHPSAASVPSVYQADFPPVVENDENVTGEWVESENVENSWWEDEYEYEDECWEGDPSYEGENAYVEDMEEYANQTLGKWGSGIPPHLGGGYGPSIPPSVGGGRAAGNPPTGRGGWTAGPTPRVEGKRRKFVWRVGWRKLV